MKKLISILLTVLMMSACIIPSYSAYTPAEANEAYDAKKIADNDDAYIGTLTLDQIADIALDYVDAYLAGIDSDIEIADGLVINTTDMLDLNTLTAWGYDAISNKLLGGDFDNLDPSALKGLSRENGDINYIYGILRFMGENADIFGKVFCWEEGQTFNCGKVGEYIESLPPDNDVRVFYEKYILGNDIQSSFTGEVAREMSYSILEGDTLDDVINNGVKAWISGMLKNNGIISENAYNTIMDDANFNLRTTDIYTLVKELISVIMDDNSEKFDTYMHLYLDNYLRIALNAAFGYTPVITEGVSADAEAVTKAFENVYDLNILAEKGEKSVIFRDAGGKYYNVSLDGASVSSVADLAFENNSGIAIAIPEISIFTGDNDALVKEYVPSATDNFDASAYTPKIYSSQTIDGLPTNGTSLPEEYQLIVDTTEAVPMKDYIKVVINQNGEEALNQTVSFDDIKAFAEEKAVEAGNRMASGMNGKVNSVDITLAYNAYVTSNTFITQVSVEKATANISIASFSTDMDITNIVKNINNNYSEYNLLISLFSAKDNYTKNLINKNVEKIEYKKEDLSQVNPQLYEWLSIINDQSSDIRISQTNSDVNTQYTQNDEKNSLKASGIEEKNDGTNNENGDISTGIKFSRKMSDYPYNMQTVIHEYLESVDNTILEYAEQCKANKDTQNKRIRINEVSDKQANDIMNLIGLDFYDYQNTLDKSGLNHIERRHGENGIANHSMKDLNDVARVGYIMHNYDSIELTDDADGNERFSRQFKDKNNNPAPLIKFTKKINGTYYAVIACPEARYKKLWLVTAYIGQKKQ